MKKPSVSAARIEWVDSCTTSGWQKADRDVRPSNIISLGIISCEDDNSISISTSACEHGRFVDQISIPKIAITKIRRFKI